METLMSRNLTLTLTFALAMLVACGDDDRSGTDAGPVDMSDVTPDGGPVDGGPVDDEAPSVIGTDPTDEAENVMPGPVQVFFSEEMNDSVGTATITASGTEVDVTSSWETGGTDLTLEAPLPLDATIEVTLDGYEDLAGNTLPTFVFSFETADVTAPYVVSSDPEEGSTAIASSQRSARECPQTISAPRAIR